MALYAPLLRFSLFKISYWMRDGAWFFTNVNRKIEYVSIGSLEDICDLSNSPPKQQCCGISWLTLSMRKRKCWVLIWIMGYREYMRFNISIGADMKQKNFWTSWLSCVDACTHMWIHMAQPCRQMSYNCLVALPKENNRMLIVLLVILLLLQLRNLYRPGS